MNNIPDARTQLIAAFRFERDFPEDFRALRAVIAKTLSTDELADDSDFRYDLGDIVYSYKSTESRKAYRQAAKNLMNSLEGIQTHLTAIEKSMSDLDSVYTRRIAEFMTAIPAFPEPNYNIGHVSRDVEKAAQVLRFYQLALGYATYFEPIPKGRSRPPLHYFVPTLQFMEIWERYTGSDVVIPKGEAKGKRAASEATQPSTEFVRLCLKMIDPKITVANTHTSIKNVLNARKENKGIPLMALIATPDLQDLKNAIKKWEELKK